MPYVNGVWVQDEEDAVDVPGAYATAGQMTGRADSQSKIKDLVSDLIGSAPQGQLTGTLPDVQRTYDRYGPLPTLEGVTIQAPTPMGQAAAVRPAGELAQGQYSDVDEALRLLSGGAATRSSFRAFDPTSAWQETGSQASVNADNLWKEIQGLLSGRGTGLEKEREQALISSRADEAEQARRASEINAAMGRGVGGGFAGGQAQAALQGQMQRGQIEAQFAAQRDQQALQRAQLEMQQLNELHKQAENAKDRDLQREIQARQALLAQDTSIIQDRLARETTAVGERGDIYRTVFEGELRQGEGAAERQNVRDIAEYEGRNRIAIEQGRLDAERNTTQFSADTKFLADKIAADLGAQELGYRTHTEMDMANLDARSKAFVGWADGMIRAVLTDETLDSAEKRDMAQDIIDQQNKVLDRELSYDELTATSQVPTAVASTEHPKNQKNIFRDNLSPQETERYETIAQNDGIDPIRDGETVAQFWKRHKAAVKTKEENERKEFVARNRRVKPKDMSPEDAARMRETRYWDRDKKKWRKKTATSSLYI